MAAQDPKDKPLVAESCCGANMAQPVLVPPEVFTPRGTEGKLGDLPYYIVEPQGGIQSTKEALIVIYDIVGTGHINNKQACDYLADASGLVAIQPDVFRGRVPIAEFFANPPEPGTPGAEIAELGLSRAVWDQIISFTTEGDGSYKKVVKNDLLATIKFLKETRGVEKFSMVGFCYGGEIIIKAAQDDDMVGPVKAVVGVHPAFITVRDSENVKMPVALLPGNNDPDFTECAETMMKNPKIPEPKSRTVLHYRGDFQDELIKRNALDCFEKTSKFVLDNMCASD
ncbi:dienelactone hydrolase family-domain-containing protein [Hyaloraphidium curvatum]|nr:dienelactone hydrolase family-domain-containing protein [Hyaloraphidium curvatum]